MKLDRILVPTDFSPNSDKALSFAIEIAQRSEARLYLMNSMKSMYSYSSEQLIDKLRTEDRLDNLESEIVQEIGDPTGSILKQIEEIDADLVVMGSRGRSGTGKKLFGSCTMDVISQSPVPVLAIPEESSYEGFDNIVFTTDYHTGDLQALQTLSGFARLYDAELHILHVANTMELETDIKYRGFQELVREKINYEHLIFENIIERSFYEGFVNYMNEHEADLLSVTRYKKSFFQNLMERDHTRQIGYHSTMPLMILIGEE
ncbi:MAG: universal stress protein [Balneolaceae bacterium]|nr:universal stress protein [Balneolaceae bacterium]